MAARLRARDGLPDEPDPEPGKIGAPGPAHAEPGDPQPRRSRDRSRIHDPR
jgi:hypothetical protein